MKKKTHPDASLAHLERYFFSQEQSVFSGDADSITIFTASDRMAEVKAFCDTVINLAREGVRYRDMAVVVSDMEAYRPVLERVHAAYGVPVFLNLRRPVRGHAAVELLFSAVQACCSGFALGDVLSLIKTGYAGINLEEGAMFENYVLRYGIHHGMFQRPFSYGPDAAEADRIRALIMQYLQPLYAVLSKPSPVHERVLACYQYIEGLELRQKLENTALTLKSAGRVTEAEEHIQIYNALVRLLEQLDMIMPDTIMGVDEFAGVLEEGLADVTLGVVPDSADSIQMSPVARSDGMSCDVLFVLGCVDGLLPKDRADDGLFNEEEKQAVAELGYPKLSGTGFISAFEQQVFYGALTRPTKKLYFFYPCMADGTEQEPSTYIKRLERMFPKLHKLSDIARLEEEPLPSCRAAALERLTDLLCEKADNGDTMREADLACLQNYFEKTEPALAEMLCKAGARGSMAISPQLAHLLYGDKLNMSASRLEKFNKCPFSHMMSYGVGAQERKEYENQPSDIGTLYHAVMQAFFGYVQENAIPLERIDENVQREIFSIIFPQIMGFFKEGVMVNDPHMMLVFRQYEEIAFKAVEAAVNHLKAGEFQPIGMEMEFDRSGSAAMAPIKIKTPSGALVTIHGIIDRVDKAVVEGKELYRVVDYKSGGRAIDFGSIYDGLTLQLPLYLAVVLENAQDGKAAGMYYMKLNCASVDEGEENDEAAYRLKGLTASEGDALYATDHALVNEKTQSKVVAGLKTVTGGNLSKNSTVACQEQISLLIDSAKRTTGKTVDRMLSGEAAAAPYENACEYCKFHSVCCFDARLSGCGKKKKRKLKLDQFLEAIYEENRSAGSGKE